MPRGFAVIPDAPRFTLRNASVPVALVDGPDLAADLDGIALADLAIADGRVAEIRPAAVRGRDDTAPPVVRSGTPELDLDRGMVWPCFVDMHTHLDKGHIWPRRRNPDGTFASAIENVRADRDANWSAGDLRPRMDFALRCAWAHGTAAIRTHLDSNWPQHRISWPVLAELRDAWKGRVDLQGVSLIGGDYIFDESFVADLVAVTKSHGGVLGGFVVGSPDDRRSVEALVRAARDAELDLDLHVDETEDPESRCLLYLAQTVLALGFKGKVTAGHCCSIARQMTGEADETLDLVAEAGISIVSLPMCNMYLQDRHPEDELAPAGPRRTPRWRGVTLVHEMRARGIPVAIASDNARDPFYAYGDLDMVEVFREAVRILHLDHPFGDWPRTVAATPAEVTGQTGLGTIRAGAAADLVLFPARTFTELLSRPQADRTVLRAGAPIDRTLPDYRELDDLMGSIAVTIDVARLKSALDGIRVEDNPAIVKQKSRDFFWYSPVLKRQLDHITGDLVVSPKSEADVVRILKACYEQAVPVTPRGAGTGNYGQAMPLSGGVVLSLADMNGVKSISSGRATVEPGVVLAQLDRETRKAVNQEIRLHPSTYNTATVAGFIAGGSGGVGSINWGGLRNIGNVLSARIVTMEAEPRILALDGWNLLKVMHAYGTNGIITEVEVPLDVAYDWVDVIVGYDDYLDAVRFADLVGNEDGLLFKEIATVAAPVPHDYFLRHQKFIRRDQSVALLMVAPHALTPFLAVAQREKAAILFRSDTATEAEKKGLPPLYELTWNHTTLRGLRVDPTITYLQVQYPFPDHVEKVALMTRIFGDEVPGHLEFTRFDGKVACSGLPIVRFTTEKRLDEIIRIHEDNGCPIFNPHRYTLEEGGMKRTDEVQLAFKREADPKGLLNPGKMIAWENPDFDWKSDRVYLFPGLQAAEG